MSRRAHGPVVLGDGHVEFRAWAPLAEHVELELRGERTPMTPAEHGWWEATARAVDGDRYGFRLDGGDLRPDPASWRQPDGVHGPSAVVDARRWSWGARERSWRAAPLAGAVVYELHVGTFTADGTLAAATAHLAGLADLGVTHVELMPLNAFNGTAGWGYDGVGWYAVHEPYGGPDQLAAFVDAAHQAGLGVLVDAVYNHLGPSGNSLPEFGPYLTDRYSTPWGDALNVDGPDSDPVRAFIIGSALHWLDTYRVDGLRLDAVHGIVDTSEHSLLAELSDAVAALSVARARPLLLIAETERNDPRDIRSREARGLGLHGEWADDLHHAVHTAVTGESEGYYADYEGLHDVARCFTGGWAYGGRWSPSRRRTVGVPLGDVPSWRLVVCDQNHDQVGNRALGERLTTLVDDDLVRVAAVLACASPMTPMLWMGEEYGETAPFQYFTSHPEPELAAAVRAGRAEEFAEFSAFAGAEVPDPQDPETVRRSTLDRTLADTTEGRARLALWRDLLALRRTVPALAPGGHERVQVLHVDDEHLALMRRGAGGEVALLAVNLSGTPWPCPAPDAAWSSLLDSADVRYGGAGASASPAAISPRSASLWTR